MKPKCSTGYLTPQNSRTRKNKENRRSENFDTVSKFPEINDSVFKKILNDPIKRNLILKLIDSEKDNIEGYKKQLKEHEKQNQNSSPLNIVKRQQPCESPTALLRRRALEQLNGGSCDNRSLTEQSNRRGSTNSSGSISDNSSPVPFEKLLDNVVAYVEVNSGGKDRSPGVKALIHSMGATVRDTFTRDVTHVIFKVYISNCSIRLKPSWFQTFFSLSYFRMVHIPHFKKQN